MSRKLEFACPNCGGNQIQQVFTDAVAFSDVTLYEDSADDVYGEIAIEGEEFCFFECVKCGWQIPITDYGASADTEVDALRRWLQKQPINMLENL